MENKIPVFDSYRDLKNSLDYAEKKGKEEGKMEDKIEIALNMLKDKMPIEVVSKYTGLSIEQIIQLTNKIN
jgi:predicted transposase/invertase (TIGR01784 family)